MGVVDVLIVVPPLFAILERHVAAVTLRPWGRRRASAASGNLPVGAPKDVGAGAPPVAGMEACGGARTSSITLQRLSSSS
jgi:hypothetical protein